MKKIYGLITYGMIGLGSAALSTTMLKNGVQLPLDMIMIGGLPIVGGLIGSEIEPRTSPSNDKVYDTCMGALIGITFGVVGVSAATNLADLLNW